MTTNDHRDVFQPWLDADSGELNELWREIGSELDGIDAEEKKLRRRREILEARRSVLEGVARLRKLQLGETTGLNRRMPAEERDLADGAPKPRDVVLTIIDDDPSRTWDAQAVDEALQRQNVITTRDNVRVILQRLNRTGALRRVGRGAYQSARATLSEQLPSDGGDET
jgi:hypothetical protein